MRRPATFLVATVLVLVAPARALAWDAPQRWFASASGAEPGGGGVIGTGGMGDHGVTCGDCHVGAEGRIGAVMLFDPPMRGGAYTPLGTYAVWVQLLGEHLGQSGCTSGQANTNGFAAAFEDASGSPAGALVSDGNTGAGACRSVIDPAQLTGSTVVYGDCRSIESAGGSGSSWSFTWTAPPPGTGPVALTYGVVDGDCGSDSLGDDVKIGASYLQEGTASAAARPADASVSTLAWLGALPATAIVRVGRRRR